MTNKEIIRTSKFLSLILRHKPERVHLKLDSAGWVAVDDLLEAVNRDEVSLTLDQPCWPTGSGGSVRRIEGR